MSTEESIFEFLTLPENLSVALEVAGQVEQLKHQMHQAFWAEFNPRMDLKVKQSEYAQTWHYQSHPARAYRKDWAKSSIAPIQTAKSPMPQTVLVLGQSTIKSDYRLFWGVSWSMSPPKDFNHPALTTLIAKLGSWNITTIELPIWIRWGFTQFVPYGSDFLSRMYREREVLIREIVDQVWDLFIELRPTLETLNASVAEFLSQDKNLS